MRREEVMQTVAAILAILGSICLVSAVIINMCALDCYLSAGIGLLGGATLLAGIRVNAVAAARIKRRGYR
jgi:hypothetical protein